MGTGRHEERGTIRMARTRHEAIPAARVARTHDVAQETLLRYATEGMIPSHVNQVTGEVTFTDEDVQEIDDKGLMSHPQEPGTYETGRGVFCSDCVRPTDILASYADEMGGMDGTCLAHSLTVARMCYALARSVLGMDVPSARHMFVMGLLHDMGYEFAPRSPRHAGVAADVLDGMGFPYAEEIRRHNDLEEGLSDASDILLCANLLVDGDGHALDTYAERLADISCRPVDSQTYRRLRKVADYLRRKGYEF